MLDRPAVETGATARRDADLSPAWRWSQRWSDLLFLHWRVPSPSLDHLLPPGLEIEEHGGSAWVSLVLFRLKVRPRWLPFVPGISSLTEVNLRTYVRTRGKSGIYFLSIFADNALSVRLARLLTPLPYQVTRMSYRRLENGFRFERTSDRLLRHGLSLEFVPSVRRRVPADESLDAWLLERYRAFAWHDRAGLVTAEVSHAPWCVGEVESFRVTQAGESCWWGGVPSCSPDLVHYSEGMDARFGAFQRVPRSEE